MTPGLRSAIAAAAALETNPPPPAILPEPWRRLLALALQASAVGLRQQDVYNSRDQSILSLTLQLLKAGRHACWTIATLYNETPGTLMCDWQTAASWHHSAMTALHAGWQRRLPAGINRALPLDANQIVLEPLAVRVTDSADRWLRQLARDPLDLSASEASTGLLAIPAGVWISP